MSWYCSTATCQADVVLAGGAQMNGCRHFLCTTCLVKAVGKSLEIGISCEMRKGFFKCNGRIELHELEFMIPDEVFADYITRITENVIIDETSELDEGGAVGGASYDHQRSRRENPLPMTTFFDDLDLTTEEKESGWAHKASMMDELIRVQRLTCEDAEFVLDSYPLLENRKPISCKICLDDEIPIGDGVILKDCLHFFCKPCLSQHIGSTDKAEVQCPFVDNDGNYTCDVNLQPREIQALVNPDEYRRHFEDLSLDEAEKTMQNVFHCLTPDCKGFCIADTNAILFQCPICSARNCVACKVIHPGSCAEYRAAIQAAERREADRKNRADEQLSVDEINRRLSNKLWMRCPKCPQVIEKNGGCLHMKCKSCNFDFNWSGVAS